jgi:WhiB family redox-sensing transcriptional regulator
MSAPPNVAQFRRQLHDTNWQHHAACRDVPSEVFFPEKGREGIAVAICLECPVREECLAHAIEHREDEGIWGGRTPAQREKIRKAIRLARAKAAAR